MIRILAFMSALLAVWLVFPAKAAEPLHLEQVLARVLATYPSLEVAALQLALVVVPVMLILSTLPGTAVLA